MSAFHEVQFPPKIAYGASGGPGFSTSIAASVNGSEQRNINWHTARGRWDVSTGIKSESDMATVLAFFRARFGKAYGFRFKDWTDYKAVGQMLGTGDNKTTQFQLYKKYESGGHSYDRRIFKPVEGSIKVEVDSKPVEKPVDKTTDQPIDKRAEDKPAYTLDTKMGLITFIRPPKKGAIINCDFEFDVPARFDIDQIIVRAAGPNNFVADSITITELMT